MATVEADWYQYPRYYDLAFRSETRREADFIEAACRQFSKVPVRALLEPGCGSGRLVVELAARGYEVVALDLADAPLEYLRRRLKRRRLSAQVFRGDMADFQLPKRVDAAYNLCNTFRHLLTEQAARRHLRCVASQLPVGGIYLLGLHLVPPDEEYEASERWSERYRGTTVTVTLRGPALPRPPRRERLQFRVAVRTPTKRFTILSNVELRTYTARQLKQLVASVPEFEPCAVFDFWYELEHPIELDDDQIDVVLVLRKRRS